jgi:hypothetical protein
MNFFMAVVLLIFGCSFIVAAVTAVTLAIGAALAYFFPLSLFQATLLIIGTAGASALTALALIIMYHLSTERILGNSFRSIRHTPKTTLKRRPE